MGKTRIYILQMKTIIYTVLFIVFGLILLLLLIYMFYYRTPKESSSALNTSTYTPGVYSTSILLGEHPVSLEIQVDRSQILSISTAPLEESVMTMYPLLEDCLENITQQLISGKELHEVSYDPAQRYTASILLDAIAFTLEKAMK